MKTSRQLSGNYSNSNTRQRDFALRLVVAFMFILLFFGILIARFVYLQVEKHNEYVAQAATNRISLIPTPPIRGEITDVNGVVLAQNYPAYSLEIIPNQVEGKIDDLIESLRSYVALDDADLRRFRKFRADYRSYEKVPLKLKLTPDEASRLAAQLYRFKGVEINARTFREYPFGSLTAHFLGYIGRISDHDMTKLTETNRAIAYRGTTHIGKSGLESYYEEQLHGKPGYQEVEKDAAGNIIRVIRSEPPQTGQTLRLSMDIRLQQEADRLMGNKRGAMVAINPQTGGILAFVSKPNFDPNIFIDGIDSDSWKALNENWQRPLINRVTQGLYPPGSTFKPFMGMALLESGKINQHTVVSAPGVWSIPNTSHLFRDSVRSGHGSVNLSKAIQVSSDTFFYKLGFELGIEKTAPYLAAFGLGQKTGIDLPNEYQGILPTPEWKEKRFARLPENKRRWNIAEMVPVSIGQGYNTYTPLQMAHATAILANNGVVYRPHLVKEMLDHENQQITVIDPQPERKLPYSLSNFNYLKRAMQRVLQAGGTARKIGEGLSYTMGGKTGTAQVVQIAQGKTYNAAALREQHRDHAWFIAFAPVDKPQIAVAVILENAGWGANAAPLARQLTDFYLLRLQTGQVSAEVQGARRTSNPLLQLTAPLNTKKSPVQAAFEAVAQEKAAVQAASSPSLQP
ncbi:penicillin-binding protein 2 [Kingella kingae]|uniref:Peptidoglycan D,D-transpeptidase MrdA n=2 Tax=Kingella kingae TaxID=504 RepID=F5S8E1_KINKI|nr:penicillin-binding protein 2 [Kingella kingae]EGK08182.1 penicillin-binding protein 2 [Kingella kingae ATCC 23330]MDK4533639.1 penicillin-binding protein 2 [Kingella kingae]MDK4540148.1 penicillin-binding protein 2 [Kingella kingae]MDK4552649.1 penicillin-binding protein 2 [Kingella kingae]MDK4563864.1 penicillin-binding protein 2 [Kingella kingae]